MARKKLVLWTDEELDSCVIAYLVMQRKQMAGVAFVKKDVYKELQSERRTAKSIEYRMQNISALMQELCLPVLSGYRPAGHLGSGVRSRVLSMLEAYGVYQSTNYMPTADDKELIERSERIYEIDLTQSPLGIQAPAMVKSITTAYERDPKMRAWVLKNSNGICEGCNLAAPFLTCAGLPFLEVHHVRRLADQGTDTISNAVALCPNCHRRCHASIDKEQFTESLFQRIDRLIRETPGQQKLQDETSNGIPSKS